jgi:hypothetical protein
MVAISIGGTTMTSLIRNVELGIVAAIAIAWPSWTTAQQVADPNFDVSVATPAFTRAHPKILFDEAHHNFHTTSGRYKAFVDLARNDGFEVTPNGDRFSRSLLQKFDVLVISNALGGDGGDASRPAFTEAECDAVSEWVKAGGRLLLVADHAPFGDAAQILAKRFGVDMSRGYTFEGPTPTGQSTTLSFTRENGRLGDHFIVNGRSQTERVNRVRTFTGQSLKGPEGSFAFLKLGDDAKDVSTPDDKNATSAAGRAQGLAFVFGRGRVVVMGEAAALSAQITGPERRPMGMNAPGNDNRQLALNIMRWLAGVE